MPVYATARPLQCTGGSMYLFARFLACAAVALPLAAQTIPIDVSKWSPERVARYKEISQTKHDPPIAVLSIPRLQYVAPVFRGSDPLTLDRGLGWIDYTAQPNSSGNTGIAGHRDGFFRPLQDIALDDVIVVTTADVSQQFIVRALEVVDPTHVEVLAPTTDPKLTLVTCYPFNFVGEAPKRLIVHATAVATASDAAAGEP